MKLTKKQALTLIKAIHEKTDYITAFQHNEAQLELKELQEQLEYFVCNTEGTSDILGKDPTPCDDGCHDSCEPKDEEEETNDEEDENDGSDEEEPSDAGGRPHDADEDEAGEVEEQDGDGGDEVEEEEPEADYTVGAGDLHDLTVAKLTHAGGSLEFEDNDDTVDIIVGGYCEVPGVNFLKRTGKEIHVRTTQGRWRIFSIEGRWPKGWASALPMDQLVEVEGK